MDPPPHVLAAAAADEEAPPAPPANWAVGAAGLAGVLLFAAYPDVAARPQYLTLAIAAAVALLPGPAAALGRALDRARSAAPRRRWIVAAGVFLAAAAYLRCAAWLAGRELYPALHDEHMYLLQARMLAEGRLWLPAHPLADFFDSFFVLVRPVYASAYFPGTALTYVPGVWLGLAPWVTAWVVTSLAVAALYGVVAALLDDVAGLFAALLALSLEDVRIVSFMTMSHSVMLLLLLLAAAAYLRWRRRPRLGGAAAVGALAGWAAVTRPADAACLVLPLLAAMLWDLRRGPVRRAAAQVAILTVAAAPFFALQLAFDKAVTGRWLRPPIALYNDVNLPGAAMAASASAPSGPAGGGSPSHLPQVRDYHRNLVDAARAARAAAASSLAGTWARDRLLPMADVALPAHVLFVLLPLGVLGIGTATNRRPPLLALLAGALLLPLVFAFWPFFLAHYALVTVPAFLVVALVGADVLRRRFPCSDGAVAVSLGVLALGAMPLAGPTLDRFPTAPTLGDVRSKLQRLDHTPAVVLFRYETGGASIHEEPVYNLDTAWPDDARVIRAHDLGARNVEIFRYYAGRQPDRYFYRYDRTTRTLSPLGLARELARQPAP